VDCSCPNKTPKCDKTFSCRTKTELNGRIILDLALFLRHKSASKVAFYRLGSTRRKLKKCVEYWKK